MSLENYIAKFSRLNVNQAQGRASPHKICMLLALLDLARSGELAENCIRFLPPLLDRYRQRRNDCQSFGSSMTNLQNG